MPSFDKHEARSWARERMRGCANVVMPTFSADLETLNEAAIRHDVRRDIELGFTGALIVAETSTTPDEYIQFTEWAIDEAQGELTYLFHASFNTLEQNIAMAHRASAAGVEICLLSYPPTFYPETSEDIYQHTKAFCDAVDLGVILFPVPLWNFERLHGAAIDPVIIERLVADCPNIVAIKAEGGFPGIAGFTHLHRLVGDQVIISMPVEDLGLALKSIVEMPWMGTSNMEYLGNSVPTMFNMIENGEFDKAMELFWQVHPARQAGKTVMTITGSNTTHRYVWKYMGWLNGFNGGPLRMPTMRVAKPQMDMMRKGLEKSGLECTTDSDRDFFIGRNP